MRRLLLATTAAAFVASAGSAFAESANDSFNMTATVQEAIAVSCDPTLSFGITAVAEGNTAGTVVVEESSAGTVTTTGTGVVHLSGGSSVTCTVTGDDDGTVGSVAINGGTGTVTLSDGATTPNTLTVTLAQSDYLAENDTFYIGGSLAIPGTFKATHPFATYEATAIDVTVTD